MSPFPPPSSPEFEVVGITPVDAFGWCLAACWPCTFSKVIRGASAPVGLRIAFRLHQWRSPKISVPTSASPVLAPPANSDFACFPGGVYRFHRDDAESGAIVLLRRKVQPVQARNQCSKSSSRRAAIAPARHCRSPVVMGRDLVPSTVTGAARARLPDSQWHRRNDSINE